MRRVRCMCSLSIVTRTEPLVVVEVRSGPATVPHHRHIGEHQVTKRQGEMEVGLASFNV